ncbi:hypothetical protein P5673_018157 [Acropora cervicornis]|uniref:Uncharacterized protein n=1 Tax=Acropora cervicornis TaxID=6130 RepID=A0AAD9QDV8_ACRCE|nr:hypothetical protein P5673_018157 [Acropora cervicornis]
MKVLRETGDLIKLKGRVVYSECIDFVKRATERISNTYGQELKSSLSAERERKESGRGKEEHTLKSHNAGYF